MDSVRRANAVSRLAARNRRETQVALLLRLLPVLFAQIHVWLPYPHIASYQFTLSV
jgi:hypothetical protein